MLIRARICRKAKISKYGAASGRTPGTSGSAKLLFVEEPDADDAILIAIGNRGPLRIHVPLHPYDLRIGIIERGHIAERHVIRDPLLECNPRLRHVASAGKCGIDLQLADAKDPL